MKLGRVVASRAYGKNYGSLPDAWKLAEELENWLYHYKEIYRSVSRGIRAVPHSGDYRLVRGLSARKGEAGMLEQTLHTGWTMRRAGEQEWLPPSVPGSVYGDLLANGRMEDPFWKDNEDKGPSLMEYDCMSMSHSLTARKKSGSQTGCFCI